MTIIYCFVPMLTWCAAVPIEMVRVRLRLLIIVDNIHTVGSIDVISPGPKPNRAGKFFSIKDERGVGVIGCFSFSVTFAEG